MKYGKVVHERLKEPDNSIEHWRKVLNEEGVEHVRKLLAPPLPVSAVWPISARQAIEEYENEKTMTQSRIDAIGEARAEMAREMFETIKAAEEQQKEWATQETVKPVEYFQVTADAGSAKVVDEIDATSVSARDAYERARRQIAVENDSLSEMTGAQYETLASIAANQESIRRTEGHGTKQRVVVEASVVKNALPSVIVPLTFSIQSALAQLDDLREGLRKNNQLPVEHPDIHERLLNMLDQISVILTGIYTAIPEDIDTVSTADSEKVAGYFTSFKNEMMLELQSYVNSKAMAKAFVPSAFILTCAGVGSFFGPLGFIAGANAGNLVLGKVKPIDVAHLVRENAYPEISDTPSSAD